MPTALVCRPDQAHAATVSVDCPDQAHEATATLVPPVGVQGEMVNGVSPPNAQVVAAVTVVVARVQLE